MSAPAVVTCIACRRNPTDGGLQCRACLEGKTTTQAAGSGGDRPQFVEPAAIAEGFAPVRTRDPARADVSEADEQREIIALLELHGWRTWRIGQRNATGTQDAGVADLYALHPRFGAVWVEAKRPDGGRQSPAQLDFQRACVAARVPYVCGALPAVRAFLATLTEPL